MTDLIEQLRSCRVFAADQMLEMPVGLRAKIIAALAAKDAEIAALKLARNRQASEHVDAIARLCAEQIVFADTQAATIAKLREALGFYARENNWRSMSKYMCGHSGETTATIDGGKRARQALEETGQ